MSLRISSLLNYTAGGVSFADLHDGDLTGIYQHFTIDIRMGWGNIHGKLAFGIDTQGSHGGLDGDIVYDVHSQLIEIRFLTVCQGDLANGEVPDISNLTFI
jgi:hypothetical protein